MKGVGDIFLLAHGIPTGCVSIAYAFPWEHLTAEVVVPIEVIIPH